MLTPQQRAGLNVALNEAELFGVEVDPARRVAAATFNVLTLPKVGPVPADRRAQLLFGNLGRVAAGYWKRIASNAPWEVVPFGIGDLLAIIRGLGKPAVHGWNFIDIDDASLRPSENRPSLEWSSEPGGRSHSITISPLGEVWALDLTVWFDVMEVRSPAGESVGLDDFIAGGKRWWDGLHAGDERTRGFGIVPGAAPGFGEMLCPHCGRGLQIEAPTTAARCADCGAEFRR
jgi:hypothetical protein